MANIDVDSVRFKPVRFREGYDMGEVDQHLELVRETLHALGLATLGGPLPGVLPSPRFTPVRLREGYDMGEVDAFLEEVAAEEVRLRSLASHGIAPAPTPRTDPVVDPSAPTATGDVSAPAATGSAYPEVIRARSSGPGLTILALVALVALVVLVVLLLR